MLIIESTEWTYILAPLIDPSRDPRLKAFPPSNGDVGVPNGLSGVTSMEPSVMRFFIQRIRVPLSLSGLVLVLCAIGLTARIIKAEEPLSYNEHIRPILVENCFSCHGADSASRKADLRLDRRDDAIEYGAIVAGD
ncbi:MAG: c-type cytochrome domain-containing protein, partial [Pirellulales bacterium]